MFLFVVQNKLCCGLAQFMEVSGDRGDAFQQDFLEQGFIIGNNPYLPADRKAEFLGPFDQLNKSSSIKLMKASPLLISAVRISATMSPLKAYSAQNRLKPSTMEVGW